MPLFGCQNGQLIGGSDYSNGLIRIDKAQTEDISVNLISLNGLPNTSDGRICRNFRPILRQSNVIASFVGASGGDSKSLDF